ncbi:MAG TPA: 30S ribosomal protein S20 [Bacilli bacterium]|nr:30S ribosomal protein S20 [Bacilli bacterium]
MPNIKSAKKRVKINQVKRETNNAVKQSMKTAIKKALKEVNTENVNDALKKIDKAYNKNVIKSNKAAREKSRLMKKSNEDKQ